MRLRTVQCGVESENRLGRKWTCEPTSLLHIVQSETFSCDGVTMPVCLSPPSGAAIPRSAFGVPNAGHGGCYVRLCLRVRELTPADVGKEKARHRAGPFLR